MSIFDFADEAISSIVDATMGERILINPRIPGRYKADTPDQSRIGLEVTGVYRRSILTTAGRQSAQESRTREVNNTTGPDFNSQFVGADIAVSVDRCWFMVDGDLCLLPKKGDMLERLDHPEDSLYTISLVEDDGGKRYLLHLVESH